MNPKQQRWIVIGLVTLVGLAMVFAMVVAPVL